MAESTDQGFEAFAQRMLALLDEGRFVATYKFAVLIGLLDVLAEQPTASQKVCTRTLARKVVSIYWPHTRPFREESVLRQNAVGQAQILTLISVFRGHTVGDETLPLTAARHRRPDEFETLVRRVQYKLIEMPLRRLQTLGNTNVPFIYECDWSETPKLREVSQDDFEANLHLLPGVREHLLRAGPLVRPLVQRTWADTVGRINEHKDRDLDKWLFGEERISLKPVTKALRDLSKGRCFYCGKGVSGEAQIDHFVPVTRRIDNSLENLVYAHGRCNGAKSHHFAAVVHLDRWLQRMTDAHSVAHFEHHATELRWDRAPAATLYAARALYTSLYDGYPLWTGGKDFEPLQTEVVRGLFPIHS